ncbi:MAG: hypothetical protein A2X12_04270 [Bacteroidetes bacterium GWE2_29_8]|nr:MAG: hypothetical protein A2X12_04270 [Bacteroidetes bacterium GWE2_29_8]OFY24999.1 MAG: hypothetical protein A2X02_08110 [Bacteroidetes bacterium GWF2_29_10]
MAKTFIKWTNNLSVKIEELDNQHKKLFDIINELYGAFMENKHKEITKKILSELAEYTHTHFSLEEKYFMLYNYPSKEEHIKQHSEFINSVKDFLIEFERNPDALTFKLMTFIQKWINNHIQFTDKLYSDFLLSKGLN